MNALEKKLPNVSNLVTKTDYNTKVSEIEKKVSDRNHDKHMTTPEFNKLTTEFSTSRFSIKDRF